MRNIKYIVLTFFVLSLLLACNPKTEPPIPGLKQDNPVRVVEGPKKSEWDKMVSLAKKEGTVVIYGSGAIAPARDIIIRTFKERYGIDSQFVLGGPEMVEKIFRERRNNVFIADVWLGGPSTFVTLLKPAGALERLEPVLTLSEVSDGKLWTEGSLAYVDQERRILAFGIQVAPHFMFNTTIVSPGEIKTFRDLLNPRWKGKIVVNDPLGPGAGQKAIAVTGSKWLGWDAIRELAKNEPIIIRDNRLQVEWVAQGKYPLAFAVFVSIVSEFQRAGAPLQLGIPSDAKYSTTSASAIALIERAPHPNAAKLFTNWFLSKEGQAISYRPLNVASRRLDVPTEGIEPLLLPVHGEKYFFSDAEDWLLKLPEYTVEMRNILEPLIKR